MLGMFFFKRKAGQNTYVYCPGCKRDMVAGDIIECIDTGFYVFYYCSCKTYSRWIFDLAPFPMLDKVYDIVG